MWTKKEFDFGVLNIKLNRNNDLELRKKILNITSDERRALGINKSTFWYLKRNVTMIKTISVHDKTFSKINKEK
ncbi:MAG: hypothetical protein GKS07_10065 [Nitrosopumilus sp.]|nr:MAG: hypothetical protein GKS07_10065 [Nitrosopumilus sp.]